MVLTYEGFQIKVTALVGRAGGDISVRFFNDTDNGKFFANCSDGTTIIGNSSSVKVTVRFGSGHQAMTELEAVAKTGDSDE